MNNKFKEFFQNTCIYYSLKKGLVIGMQTIILFTDFDFCALNLVKH